jgi:polysaccharide export outer membrane protein
MATRMKVLRLGRVLILILAFSAVVGTFVYGVESPTSLTAVPSGASAGEGGAASGQGLTSDAYVIKVDDILTIEGTPHLELKARSYRVSEDGTIMVPYLKRVPVAGMTKRELEETLMEKYDPAYFKNLVINVEVRSKTFNIIGNVRVPGVKELITETSILTAIALAGDFTEYASEKKVTVIRRNAEGNLTRTVVDCKAIMDGKAPDDFIVKPNDLIVVPRSGVFGS